VIGHSLPALLIALWRRARMPPATESTPQLLPLSHAKLKAT
jgi:hypothetical protein